LNEGAPNPDGYGFGAILGRELLHYMADVHFDSLFANEEPVADLPIAVSVGNQPQDLELAFAERFLAHVLREISREFRRNALFSGMDFTNRTDQLLPRHALEKSAAGAGFECSLYFNISVECSEHDDAGAWKL
jgi:hypothetical protein